MKKTVNIKDTIETIGAVVFPSIMLGLTVALGIFGVMGLEFCEETYDRFSTVVSISSLVFAIFFSIKATIFHMEQKQKANRMMDKNDKIVQFDKNQKLFERRSRIS